ncbi:D-alanyl-D-alanine carboxypeptidase/D-alanyl-D-alanine endopeptidase [Bacillus massiliglaciei]|uniref:D-alanyl-D-alanine carboxypeptidase/D-alanyl-D-alanine endopeptidase n=1 Tax=Bacillus massiliglaciei TaxID=1816693 RepID=UPI000ABDF8C1|nr:D-alanyl-D-alanine carboxypeptidase/D-alanyl-D-alanine-endopeptidase [Bacillus massiliglaciei]
MKRGIRRSFSWTLALILLLAPGKEIFSQESGLKSQLNQIIEGSGSLQGSLAGVSIREAETGKILYTHNGDLRLRPASNLKLLTAASALEVLGETFRFKTEIYLDGLQAGPFLKGNVYIKGKGDPTLRKQDLDRLAGVLRIRGIQFISGDIIGDSSWYDGQLHSADLQEADKLEAYGAPISALTLSPDGQYDAGTVRVDIRPGDKPGTAARVELIPRNDYMRVVNQAKTVDTDGKEAIEIKRERLENTIHVTGTIPLSQNRVKQRVPVLDPSHYTVSMFVKSLKTQGIHLAGNVSAGITPNDAKKAAEHESIPLSDLLVPFMKLSNNGHGEVLVKEMGKVKHGEGSWEEGLEVMNDTLKTFSLHRDSMNIRDGSGMSHMNLVTANQMSELLFQVQDKTWFSSYEESLPIAGEKGKFVGGTLRNRMKGTEAEGNARAKTGTLTGVSTLSGYVTGKNGKTYIFSILLNNFLEESRITEVQDQIAVLLAEQTGTD